MEYNCGCSWLMVKKYICNGSYSSSLTVTHDSIYRILISPKIQEIDVSSKQTFVATAYDFNGNSWDATDLTIWSINSNAGGYWSNNVYTPANSGSWQVVATIAGLSDTALITIDHGQTIAIGINPKTAFITAGGNQAYSAMASDSNSNAWDVTEKSTWLTSASAGGYWTQNVYTSQNSGNWVVTGQSDAKTDTASLLFTIKLTLIMTEQLTTWTQYISAMFTLNTIKTTSSLLCAI